MARDQFAGFMRLDGHERRGLTHEDADLLRELLEHHAELEARELEAFESMLERNRALSDAQRQWAEDAAKRLGLALSAANLVSNGKVPPQRREVPEYEALRASRPLKPPGRK